MAERSTIGFTQISEWLLVDVNIITKIDFKMPMWDVLDRIAERGGIDRIGDTVIIDLLEADSETRAYILDRENWPKMR